MIICIQNQHIYKIADYDSLLEEKKNLDKLKDCEFFAYPLKHYHIIKLSSAEIEIIKSNYDQQYNISHCLALNFVSGITLREFIDIHGNIDEIGNIIVEFLDSVIFAYEDMGICSSHFGIDNIIVTPELKLFVDDISDNLEENNIDKMHELILSITDEFQLFLNDWDRKNYNEMKNQYYSSNHNGFKDEMIKDIISFFGK